MNILYEISDVKIEPYRTVAEALEAGFRKFAKEKAISKAVLHTLHLDNKTKAALEKEEEIEIMLRQPLWSGYESELSYTRTLALVSLESKIEVKDFCRELAQSGYFLASLSESMSYVPILINQHIKIDYILHLGTILRNERFEEFRLLTKNKGESELISFYPGTKLKPYYHIVVVKKEKK